MRLVIREKWYGRAVAVIGVLLLLAGCANLNTIDRETPFNSSNNKGKAIHLDIQQRLVVVNDIGKYCAEPSPDALAAFAAAAGIGASTPTQGAVSAAGGASSSAASIGLRTQSITLMRDALYRMCEAYSNGQLSGPQVMALLGRTQYMTAVVLATEQLTGAVVAQQAALSSTTAADATAIMTATSQLVEAALKQQERAEVRLEKAIERKADAEGKLAEAEDEVNTAQAIRDSAAGDDVQSAETRLAKAVTDRDAANRKVELAENIRALREQTLVAATERVEALQLAQDTAATTAVAAASSNAALSGGSDRSRLSDQSTQAIATAVTDMVNNVVNKSYAEDYCLAIITSDSVSHTTEISDDDRELCRDVLLNAAVAEQYRISATDAFDESDRRTTDCIGNWLDKQDSNMQSLTRWREQNNAGNHVIFMRGKSAAKLRSKAIEDLSIPCN